MVAEKSATIALKSATIDIEVVELISSLQICPVKQIEMKPFITSDESVVNKYGFRVLTSGIDTSQFERNPLMYYMHNRNLYNLKGNEVIGKWENLKKKSGKLVGEPIIDDKEKFAATIKGKVDRGFLRMASIGIQIIETSSDPKHLLNGQTRPTVTKCVLREISIVDEGANDNALQLYSETGTPIELSTGLTEIPELQKLNFKNEINMSQLKSVALALGLAADATEPDVLSALATLKTGKTDAETKLKTIEDAQKELKTKEAKDLVGKASAVLKLEGDAKTSFETAYSALFAADHDNTKTAVESLLSGAGTTKPDNKGAVVLSTFMKDVKGNAATEGSDAPSFDYLQKKNPTELARLKADEPDTYQQLVADYATGVRHTN